MSEAFLDERVVLHAGDCVEIMKALADNSVDAVVTDPPYHLTEMTKRYGNPDAKTCGAGTDGSFRRLTRGFMGKQWDGGDLAQSPALWTEVLRVLKPGGHMVAFSGTRTYHRMACAIEDAGFEVRDSLYWHYGSGFPKSRNVIKDLQESGHSCTCHKSMLSNHHVSDENLRDLRNALGALDAVSGDAEPDMRSGLYEGADREDGRREAVAVQQAGDDCLRSVRQAKNDAASMASQSQDTDLLQTLQWGVARSGVGETRTQGQRSGNARGQSAETCSLSAREEPGLEGRSDAEASSRELLRGPLHQSAGMGEADGASGWLHHGASARDGEDVRFSADEDGSRKPQEPASRSQRAVKLGVVADERRPQAWGGWPVCDGCGKPMVPEGLGTALKPATEPICLARKPLSEKTVAANVLRWGTGALNIDGCRVEASDKTRAPVGQYGGSIIGPNGHKGARNGSQDHLGRFPANLCHDGSQEVLAAFPESAPSKAADRGTMGRSPFSEIDASGRNAGTSGVRGHTDNGGSAARFFYSAKADSDNRLASKHPTVKPLDLMQWLCKLITPPGGVVLDPFAGTGTTGEAAWREGFRAILIEREAEYQADIRRRMKYALGGPDERKHVIIKAKGQIADAGPLFGGLLRVE